MSTTVIAKGTWANLYKQLQREANGVPHSNYRLFFQRRIRDYFEKNRGETSVEKQQDLYQEGLRNLEIIKRQSIIGQLYPHKKTVVEEKLAH